jgi:WD40 repeat protein
VSACLLVAVSPGAGAAAGEEAKPATDLYGDALPAGAVARLGTVRLRHGCLGLVFAPGGKVLASAGTDRLVRLWEVATGKEVRQFKGHAHYVSAVAFSADGKTLVSASLDGALRLWEAASGKELRTLRGGGKPTEAAMALALAPDNRTLVTVEWDRTVRVWDLATGKERQAMAAHRPAPANGQPPGGGVRVALAPDGKHFATAGKDGAVAVWEVATGKEVVRFRPQHKALSCLLFSPDGKALATAGAEPTVFLWDARTGAELRRFEAPGGLLHILAFSPSGRYLAGQRPGGPLLLWGVASGKVLRALDLPRHGVGAMAFSPDGRVIAACQGQAIRVWDLGKNRELHQWPGHDGAIEDVRFAADGKRLISTAWDHTARVWESATGRLLQTWVGPTDLHVAIRITPNGSLLAPARSKVVRVELTGAKAAQRDLLTGLPGWLSCLAVSADGKLWAGRGRDRTLRLYSTETGKKVCGLEGDHERYFAVGFSPDGKLVAGGGSGVPVVLWEVPSGKEVRRFDVVNRYGSFKTFGVSSLAFTPDGKGLLTVSSQAILWEVATGRERWRAGWPTGGLRQGAFAPDGRAVALGSNFGTVHVAETRAGGEVGRLEGHRGGVTALAFAPDGKTFVSGSDDGTALVWDAVAARRKAAPPPARLTAKELARLWKDLGGEDAARAYRAIWSLVADPHQAVPLLQERLQGGAKEDLERFARLLQGLNDKAFAVREAAQKELEQWEELPAALLHKATGDAPAEVQRRLKRVLERRKPPDPMTVRVHTLRALEALEHIGTAEASRALEGLSAGAPEAWLMAEARAALGRLRARR